MKKKIVFGIGVTALVAVGATGLVFSMDQERNRTHTEAYAMGNSMVSAAIDSAVATGSANKSSQNSQKDYGEVATYAPEERQAKVKKCEDVLRGMSDYCESDPDKGELKVTTVYEYRGQTAYFVWQKQKASRKYALPDAMDTEPEKIVKNTIDIMLDGMQLELPEDTHIILSMWQYESEQEKGKIERKYMIDVESKKMLERRNPCKCLFEYNAIAGNLISFEALSDSEPNQSELKKWQDTWKSKEVEKDEKKQLQDNYIKKINKQLAERYGLPKMKEILKGYVEYNSLVLLYKTEGGELASIGYDLNKESIASYTIDWAENFDKDFTFFVDER